MNEEGARGELRELPPVDLLQARLSEAAQAAGIPRELLLAWIREALEAARGTIRSGAGKRTSSGRSRSDWVEHLSGQIESMLRARHRQTLGRVINATGVLLHTNLGRAPLPAQAQQALMEATAGYSTLEIDLESGRRRSRLDPIRRLLPLVTGAESGLAVHNNAAAVFLALTTLAAGREVVVSRGHLVEIGGSFRLPEIMEASGCRLVEVGSTNRTRLQDYARAIGPETALLLQVHPSNFRLIGFTEEVPSRDLAALAQERGIPFLFDLGSGALRQHGKLCLDEPRVQDALEGGADLVCFSADKLLGGPQAGILVGKKRWIDPIGQHPVARVVRLDKAALAALEATLEAYLDPATLLQRIPLLGLLARGEEELQLRAEQTAAALRAALPPSWKIEIVPTTAEVGGGSLPGLELPSRAVVLSSPGWSPEAASRALRRADPPVVGRIEKDRLLLDVRALLDGEEVLLARAAAALADPPGEIP